WRAGSHVCRASLELEEKLSAISLRGRASTITDPDRRAAKQTLFSVHGHLCDRVGSDRCSQRPGHSTVLQTYSKGHLGLENRAGPVHGNWSLRGCARRAEGSTVGTAGGAQGAAERQPGWAPRTVARALACDETHRRRRRAWMGSFSSHA